MTVEERLRSALSGTAGYEPSPDLFAKVRGSIEDDRAHRRRVLRIAAGVAALTAVIAAWLAVWWDPQPGMAPLPWWSVISAVVAIEVAVVAALRPSIRRLGHVYAEDVFRTNRQTGPRFLALLDVAYYLVFIGYISARIPFVPDHVWQFGGGFPDLLRSGAAMIGGLLLLMGGLHALTIFVLPFTGLVFASIRHRMQVPETKAQWKPEVRRAHRTVSYLLIAVGVMIAFGALWTLLAVIGIAADT
ncbi:MAG: hypothetical protein EHM57_04130 [Actinobacteria bacterium]|nr:MAG: hypothetical protein EHM57_04130 [Actinomycetota bacterium]